MANGPGEDTWADSYIEGARKPVPIGWGRNPGLTPQASVIGATSCKKRPVMNHAWPPDGRRGLIFWSLQAKTRRYLDTTACRRPLYAGLAIPSTQTQAPQPFLDPAACRIRISGPVACPDTRGTAQKVMFAHDTHYSKSTVDLLLRAGTSESRMDGQGKGCHKPCRSRDGANPYRSHREPGRGRPFVGRGGRHFRPEARIIRSSGAGEPHRRRVAFFFSASKESRAAFMAAGRAAFTGRTGRQEDDSSPPWRSCSGIAIKSRSEIGVNRARGGGHWFPSCVLPGPFPPAPLQAVQRGKQRCPFSWKHSEVSAAPQRHRIPVGAPDGPLYRQRDTANEAGTEDTSAHDVSALQVTCSGYQPH